MSDEAHRDIVETAMKPLDRVKLESLVTEIEREVKLPDVEFTAFESIWNGSPAQGANFNARR